MSGDYGNLVHFFFDPGNALSGCFYVFYLSKHEREALSNMILLKRVQQYARLLLKYANIGVYYLSGDSGSPDRTPASVY